MMPGPPPVMTAKPARASRRAVATATPYIGSLRGVRAELADGDTGLVNAAFRAKYEAMFGDACPAAASDAELGAL